MRRAIITIILNPVLVRVCTRSNDVSLNAFSTIAYTFPGSQVKKMVGYLWEQPNEKIVSNKKEKTMIVLNVMECANRFIARATDRILCGKRVVIRAPRRQMEPGLDCETCPLCCRPRVRCQSAGGCASGAVFRDGTKCVYYVHTQ